jgi:tetratricopeptide (TPR) repeat protein
MDGAAGSARALVAEIAAALEDGDNEAAADLAADGLTAFPDATVLHRLRGIALFALGVTDEAKVELTAALAVDPLDNAALISLANVSDLLGDPYTAAEYLLTAWEHDPANQRLRAELTERLATLYGPEGYLQFTRPALAALYARNAFPIRAEREYRDIIAEHPDRLDLRLAAALARWRLGRLAETVETCTALLAERPQLVRLRWVLADALARQGHGEVAREHTKQAAHYDPDGSIARELIAMTPDAAIVDPDEPIVAGHAQSIEHIPEASVADPPARQGDEAPDAADVLPTIGLLSEEVITVASPAVAGVAATGAFTAALGNPQDVPYLPPEEQADIAATPSAADREPEPVQAIAEEDGQIIATMPGGEPMLDATDALPAPPAPPPDRQAEPSPGTPAVRRQPGAPAVPPITVEAAVISARERSAVGDFAGAVAGMRAALQAVGSDRERVRALLPALRALVDAAHRPDAHRLLGDAYRRLELYTQAEGQYRQALLVRVAGKQAAHQ